MLNYETIMKLCDSAIYEKRIQATDTRMKKADYNHIVGEIAGIREIKERILELHRKNEDLDDDAE